MSIPAFNAVDVSASSIMANSTTGHHVLKIEQSSWMKTVTQQYSCIQSRSFRVGGCTWHIDLYPNGCSSGSAGFLSFFIVLDDRADNLSANAAATFAFALLDPDGGVPMPGYAAAGQVFRLTGKGVQWGCEYFIGAQELEKAEFVKDDSFSVRCDITVVDVRAGRELGVVPPPPDLPRHLHDLLSSGEGADVRFRVSGETFAAHRCVLAARSPVFKAGLFGAMKESSTADCIEVDGIRADVFGTLLHFIYTDSLPPETKGKEEEDAAMAQHLLVAADMYGMERLKLICADRLCGYIGVSTAATTLVLAEQHRCRGLKEACFEFLKRPTTLEAVKATDGFPHLAKACPSLLPEMMLKFSMWE